MREPTVMRAFCWFLLISLAGCAQGIVGGDPLLPLSTTNGTTRVFETTEGYVLAAISNAFDGLQYRKMSLSEASTSNWDYLVTGWRPSSGFVLQPLGKPWIAQVPIGAKKPTWVPYKAYFHITVQPVSVDRASVNVKTVLAMVADGEETGLHGGTAEHVRQVRGVQQEEEAVLAAIGKELELHEPTNAPNVPKK